MRRVWITTTVAATLALALAPCVASAATIQLKLDSVTAGASGGWDWTYSAELTLDSQIDGSDIPATQRNIARFIIYDFNQFQGLASKPASWLFNTQNVGPYPFAQSPVDNPNVINLVFTYDAANNPTINNIDAAAAVHLGMFIANSTLGFTSFVTGNYSSEDTREVVEATNTLAPGGHTSVLPVPGQSVPIPEPASLLLVGTGLLGLARRFRPRR